MDDQEGRHVKLIRNLGGLIAISLAVAACQTSADASPPAASISPECGLAEVIFREKAQEPHPNGFETYSPSFIGASYPMNVVRSAWRKETPPADLIETVPSWTADSAFTCRNVVDAARSLEVTLKTTPQPQGRLTPQQYLGRGHILSKPLISKSGDAAIAMYWSDGRTVLIYANKSGNTWRTVTEALLSIS